jgi:hypothetical protein
MLGQTVLSFPLLSDFIGVSIHNITFNLYTTLVNLFQTLHLQQSLSHLFYTFLNQSNCQYSQLTALTSQGIATNANSTTSSLSTILKFQSIIDLIKTPSWLRLKPFIEDWYDQYHKQNQLFTQKSQLFFQLTTIPIDLRFQPSSTLSSKRFMYQYLLHKNHPNQLNNQQNHQNPRPNPISSTQLEFFEQYFRRYHHLSRITLPLFQQQDLLNSPSKNSQLIDLYHFYQNIPYYALNSLISILISQYTDIYEPTQNQLLGKFFAAVELNTLNLHSYSLTKKQKTIMSQLVHSPTISINFKNSLLYPINDNLMKLTHNHDQFRFKFTFPKAFPSFSTRLTTFSRILVTLQAFAQDYIYPTLFDQHSPFQSLNSSNSTTLTSIGSNNLPSTDPTLSISNQNSQQQSNFPSQSPQSNDISSLGCLTSLSKYVYKLNDVLYIKTSSIPWLFDGFFNCPGEFGDATNGSGQNDAGGTGMDDSDANSTENKKTSQNINDSNDDVDSNQISAATTKKAVLNHHTLLLDAMTMQNNDESGDEESAKRIKSTTRYHTNQQKDREADRSDAITPVLDDILNRLEHDTNQTVDFTLVPVSQLYQIASQSIPFTQSNPVQLLNNPLKTNTNSQNQQYPPSLAPTLLNYYPGLKLLLDLQPQPQQLQNSSNAISPDEPMIDYIIPYKSYIVYLAALLETCCLIASMPSNFTSSALTNPKLNPTSSINLTNSAPTSINSSNLSTNKKTTSDSNNLNYYNTNSNQCHDYDIYSVPYLFPTMQPIKFEPFMTALSNSVLNLLNNNNSKNGNHNNQTNNNFSAPSFDSSQTY